MIHIVPNKYFYIVLSFLITLFSITHVKYHSCGFINFGECNKFIAGSPLTFINIQNDTFAGDFITTTRGTLLFAYVVKNYAGYIKQSGNPLEITSLYIPAFLVDWIFWFLLLISIKQVFIKLKKFMNKKQDGLNS